MITADFGKAKEEAQKLIDDNYISEPPIDVIEIAQNLGVDIKYIDFGEKYNNVAGYIKIVEEKKTIYVNKNDALNRQIFTIAHELGHLILHKTQLENKSDIAILLRTPIGNNEIDPLEKEANCFAANLLVPTVMLNQHKDKSIDILVNIFKVSKDVIGFRLKIEYGK